MPLGGDVALGRGGRGGDERRGGGAGPVVAPTPTACDAGRIGLIASGLAEPV